MFPTALLLVVVVAAVVRTRDLAALGLSSDEAVYLGQGRAIGDDTVPQVRAHAPLMGALLRLVPNGTTGEVVPRTVAVAVGLVAIVVAGLLAREVSGRVAGLLASLIVAAMPYHADVTRLALVEVPMATTVAVGILLVVRGVRRGQHALVEAAAPTLAVATLFKETAVLSALAIAVAVLSGVVTLPRATAWRAAAWYGAVVATYPVYLVATGGLSAALEYGRWQLSRTPTGGPSYAEVVLPRLGWGILLLGAVGAVAVVARRQREGVVLVLTVVVPAAFYVLWPVASYPYLLALVAPLAALAGCGVVRLGRAMASPRVRFGAPAAVLGAALVVSTGAARAEGEAPLLPGASGVPAVREAAHELAARPQVPVVTGAPWVANVLRHYLPDHHPVSSLASAGRDPARVNPAYRSGSSRTLPQGAVAVVWDAWTATSDPVGAAHLLALARERGGRVAHVGTDPASPVPRPLVVVFLIDSAAARHPS